MRQSGWEEKGCSFKKAEQQMLSGPKEPLKGGDGQGANQIKNTYGRYCEGKM